MVLTKVLGNGCQGDLTLQVLITYASRSFFVLTCVVSGCVAPCIMTSFHLLNATTSSTKTPTAFQLFPVIFVFSLFFSFVSVFQLNVFFAFFFFYRYLFFFFLFKKKNFSRCFFDPFDNLLNNESPKSPNKQKINSV